MAERHSRGGSSLSGRPVSEEEARAIEREGCGLSFKAEPPKRHPSSERFHQILREAGEMHDLKQADYGTDGDPFANVRATEDWGIPAWAGAAIRLNDKVRRLQSMLRNGSLKNESVQDSFLDIAVYAIIGLVLYEETLEG